MAASLEIQDGNPIWLSPAIIPSLDTVVSPNSTPTTAAVHVADRNIFVYVNVKNTGTEDLGTCPCPTGAWPGIVFFQGFLDSTTGTTTQSQGGITFTAARSGDMISGNGINYPIGSSGSGRRAWAWSPDGNFFAWVGSAYGSDWSLKILALKDITLPNGTRIAKGTPAANNSGTFASGQPQWNNSNFGWAGSSAVMSSGQAAGSGGNARSLTFPLSSSSKTYNNLASDYPGQVEWSFLISPCETVVAYLPKIIGGGNANYLTLIGTRTGATVQIKKNNAPSLVQIVGPNPSIKTVAHTANGIQIDTGRGAQVTIDDPDCTFVGGGGITVTVDRVKASTLPSGNLGVLSVGNGNVGALAVGKSFWVQVPNRNQNGWANQSEQHWCLLAQAYTDDLTTIPRPWNGQSNPPSFPVNKTNCAQKNIQIL